MKRGMLNIPLFIFMLLAIMIFIQVLPAWSSMASSISAQMPTPLQGNYVKIIPPILFLFALFMLGSTIFSQGGG